MILSKWCTRVFFVTCSLLGLWLTGCGGGGGSSSGGGGAGGVPSPTVRGTFTPNARGTSTPTSQGGPTSPTDTPAPPGTPTPTATDSPTIGAIPGESLTDIMKAAPAGSIVYVDPGTYGPLVLRAGDLQGDITLLANPTNENVNSAVTINAGNQAVAVDLDGQVSLVIGGITIAGGSEASLRITNGSGIVIQDCVIKGKGGTLEAGEGIKLVASDSVLLLDNLIYGKLGSGIQAIADSNLDIINNTIYGNGTSGIFVSGGSTSVFAENNIINKNKVKGIDIDRSDFFGDFNLNTDGYRGTEAGPSDLNADPLFFGPFFGDFHLVQGSLAIDAGDSETDPDILDVLAARTTQLDNTPDDNGFPDLGYHSALPLETPTPVVPPTNTRRAATATGTRGVPTATPTPTRTPTRPAGTPGTPTITPTPSNTVRGPQHSPTRTPKS